MDSGATRQKRKAYFKSSAGKPINSKKARREIGVGLVGFLCTNNGKSKECTREAYNILNEYADKLYPPTSIHEDNKGGDGEDVEEQNDKEGGLDIEDELQNEIQTLNDQLANDERRFQFVNTGVNGCVFIKTTLKNPVELSVAIMRDIMSTKKNKSKYLLRLLPVEVVCKAYLEDIKKASQKLFETHFKGDATTYAIAFNKRNNDNVNRDEVIESVARLVKDRNLNHKVDLKNPRLTVILEIMKNLCLISVVPDFQLLRKYNLVQLAIVDDHTKKDT